MTQEEVIKYLNTLYMALVVFPNQQISLGNSWHHGIGYCDNCAYHKEYIKRHSAKMEEEEK